MQAVTGKKSIIQVSSKQLATEMDPSHLYMNE